MPGLRPQACDLYTFEEDEHETFQFESDPEVSRKAFINPVGIHGVNVIRMSSVQGGAINCPGLIGPSEMARWQVVMDFAQKKICMKGQWQTMLLTGTRHPAACLLDFCQTREFWEDADIQQTLQLLRRSPHSWAFTVKDMEQEETSEEEEEESDQEDDSSEEESMSEEDWNARYRKVLQKLDADMKVLPVQEVERAQRDEEEWELGSEKEDAVSIPSHEFGLEEEENSEESDEEVQNSWFCKGVRKWFSKKEKGEVRQGAKELKEVHFERKVAQRRQAEVKEGKAQKFERKKNRSGPRKVLELFTWTCMISLCAVGMGNWKMQEPISLPNWDLFREDHQKEAIQYLRECDPDLLVIAWPCQFWSMLQEFGRKTEDQWQKLAEMRKKHRVLLRFVRKVVKEQRERGGALLGENPYTSRAWQEPDILEAFQGMPTVVTDMCQFNLKKPGAESEDGRPLYLRKRTRLAGTREILEACQRKCQGQHEHTPVLGGVKIKGKWYALSDFAGGHTKEFAKAVVKGAEAYLKKGKINESFVERENMPKERLAPVGGGSN